MTPFRGTDDQLDREIAALERISRVRLRRASAELNDIDKDLRELRKERSRRRAEVPPVAAPVAQSEEVV
ncbi:MAG TPA: hypothetical protein VEH28_00180 [Thermoplasmata archaeon]|nr:hypothetical protein [Thermoplasmata archaeon]